MRTLASPENRHTTGKIGKVKEGVGTAASIL
jgi:hypothetical protein